MALFSTGTPALAGQRYLTTSPCRTSAACFSPGMGFLQKINSSSLRLMSYRSSLSDDQVAALRRWHERAYQELIVPGERRLSYLGLDLIVPPGVFPPTPMSDLLGHAVLEVVDAKDRVLDMGTGSGVNAILAARSAPEVLGVDINPLAVAAARHNAKRKWGSGGVRGERCVRQRHRHLRPRDHRPTVSLVRPAGCGRAAITDEDCAATGRFYAEVPQRLRPGGRVLLFFGTSGDQEHILALAAGAGLRAVVVATRRLTQQGTTVDYSTFRLTPLGVRARMPASPRS